MVHYSTLFVDHDPGNMRRDRPRVLGPEHTPLRFTTQMASNPEGVGGFCDVACAARGEVVVRLPDAGRRTLRVSPVASPSGMGCAAWRMSSATQLG